MSTNTLRLVDGPNAAAQGRAYVAAELAGLPRGVIDDAQLVLTELVSNAQLHGAPPVVVSVTRQGDGARVEVADSGRRRLVLPAQSTDAMTGRGLAMVRAVARSWGVDPVPGDGKVVWAVVGTGDEEADLDLELDGRLPVWDVEPDDPEFTIRLGAVPTGLLLDAKRHIDNVVRELTLTRAGASEPLPAELETLIDTVVHDFARARAGLKEQAAAAAERGETHTDLVLTLPVSSVDAGRRYLAALDEVDRYAREARLLTLETPPLHRLFRRWYVTALIEQLQAHARGSEPITSVPFVDVLVQEVEQLSALRETAHRLDLLQRMNAALTEAQTAEGMARTVTSAAVRELGAVTARVYLVRGSRLEAVGEAATPVLAPPAYDSLPLDADLPGPLVLRTGEPLVVRSLRQLIERFPRLAGIPVSERALHVVPLEVGRHRLGILALGFPPTSQYDEAAQTRYVRALADVLAQGLERIAAAEQLTDLQERAGRLRPVPTGTSPVGSPGSRAVLSLADAAAAIAGTRSVQALLEVVKEAAASIVGAEHAEATRRSGLPSTVRRSAHSLAVPFISRDGRNIGQLELGLKKDGTSFDAADEAIAVQLALMASATLEHVEVADELARAMSRLRDEQKIVQALHDVGRAVTSRLEHAEVVQTVTDAATSLTGAQFGAFFYNVVGDTGEAYSLYTISGVPREAFSRFPMPRNTEIFRPTFSGEGVVRLDDVTVDPRYGRTDPHFGMPAGHLPVRSYLAVPVRLSNGEVIGGLFFGHADPGIFDDDAERLAVGIAGYAGIALENGRLYDAARRESRAKQEVAAALEEPLAPPELPHIPNVEIGAVSEPFGGGSRLGGDFYDVFPIGDERWMLALGDVAGKGPEAAALTGLVRYTLWGAAQYAPDPVAVASAVNAALLRGRSERFATLVIAVLTPRDNGVIVDAVWAGHPPAVLVRAEGVDLVSGDGVPVGLFAEFAAEPVRFTVSPGETLLLHTDGLVERAGAVLDERTLTELVRRHAGLAVQDLLAAVTAAIRARHPARDDVAAVALRCSARGA